jgi:hypothetical protein
MAEIERFELPVAHAHEADQLLAVVDGKLVVRLGVVLEASRWYRGHCRSSLARLRQMFQEGAADRAGRPFAF